MMRSVCGGYKIKNGWEFVVPRYMIGGIGRKNGSLIYSRTGDTST